MRELRKMEALMALLAMAGKGHGGMPGMDDEMSGLGMFSSMDDDCDCPICTARREAEGGRRSSGGNPFADMLKATTVPKSGHHILAEAELAAEMAKAAYLAQSVLEFANQRDRLTKEIEQNGKSMTEERERLGKEMNDLFQKLCETKNEVENIREKLEATKRRVGKAHKKANRASDLLDTVRNIVTSSNGDMTDTVAQLREALGVPAPVAASVD